MREEGRERACFVSSGAASREVVLAPKRSQPRRPTVARLACHQPGMRMKKKNYCKMQNVQIVYYEQSAFLTALVVRLLNFLDISNIACTQFYANCKRVP